MEILEGEALYRTLLQSYSRRPSGWNVTVSRSSRNGFFDALVVGGPEESWHLKLDSIFKPSPLILGARTDPDLSKEQDSPISFGFRKIGSRETPLPLDDSPGGIARLLAFLGSAKPEAPREGENYLQGPVLFTKQDQLVGRLPAERQTVDQRLSQEMSKLVQRRYPSYS